MDAVNEPGEWILNLEVLGQLVRNIERTDVDELEISVGSCRLYLRREPGSHAPGAAVSVEQHDSAADGVPVAAPLTGIYYSRATPDHEPFVTVGDQIEAGQVVALIETMKLFNEVTVDFACEILDIVVNDGNLVQVGQPILRVHPRTDESTGGEVVG